MENVKYISTIHHDEVTVLHNTYEVFCWLRCGSGSVGRAVIYKQQGWWFNSQSVLITC